MPFQLGHASYIHEGADLPFDGRVVVGKYTSIAKGCLFLCGPEALHGSAGTQYVSNYLWKHVDRGEIRIGNDVWIGSRAIILPGVTIGDGAIVGAGAVISKYVPPYGIAVGNPARVVKYRFTESQIDDLLALCWWDWPVDKVEAARQSPSFNNVAEFLKEHIGQE